MDFRTAMEHYKAGTASDVERQLVESELEKNRLIGEYLDAEWSSSASFDPPSEDIGKVRHLLKRRDRKTVTKVVALMFALALLILFVLMPLIESFFWSPEDHTYSAIMRDVELVYQAYTELFHPGKQVNHVYASDTGFASYDLTIHVRDHSRSTWYDLSGSMKHGRLYLSESFYDSDSPDVYTFRTLEDFEIREALEKLEQLPEYITVQAAVTFPEDLDMEALTAFELEYTFSSAEYPLQLEWAAIRNCSPESRLTICGIDLMNDRFDEGINEYYPQFYITGINPDGSYLEQHFKSLLQFSSDMAEMGRGMGLSSGYYDAVLEYVEENGVYSYGCIVSGSPKALLHLYDEGVVTQILILDAWLDVN